MISHREDRDPGTMTHSLIRYLLSIYCVSDVAEHWGFRREQANKVPAGMELTSTGGDTVGRISDGMTAGKRKKRDLC